MFQANLGNVREFKLAMKVLKAEGQANFRVALTEAFKSFSKVRKCLCKSKKWITLLNRDQLDVTCFIISIFTAQHVSDVNTSILRSLQLI